MKFLIRWTFRFLLLAIVLIVAVLFLKDTIAKEFAESIVRDRTGLDARIGRLEFSLTRPRVVVENLKLFNKPEFGDSPLIDAPIVELEYDPAALAMRQIHLKLLRLHLREINVVESRDGRTNFLEVLGKAWPNGPREPARSRTNIANGFQGIDTLCLSVDTLKLSSLRKPSQFTECKLGLKDEVISNVRSLDDLSGPFVRIAIQKGVSILAPQASAGQAPFKNSTAATDHSAEVVEVKRAGTSGTQVRTAIRPEKPSKSLKSSP